MAEALSELLKPSRPRPLRLADRMAAAEWLVNRGWGRAPLVVSDERERPLPFDPSQLTPEEQGEMRRLLVKGTPGGTVPALPR